MKGRPYGVDLLLPQKYAGADEGGLDRDAVRSLLPPEQQQFVDDILAPLRGARAAQPRQRRRARAAAAA